VGGWGIQILERLIDKDRAQAFARDALAWMAQRDIAPTPENFELVYAYVGMEDSDLKRTMDGLVGNGCKFDANVMSILHARFFQAGKENDAMAELGAKITAELDAVLKLIHNAGRDQSAFGSTLSRATGELGHVDSADGKIKALIDHVIHATRAMEARSKTLELQLQTSSSEVAVLRERLESVRRESLTDTLTGIANRKAFESELATSIERALQDNEPLALLMCDIDHFKVFNDTWGHQTGDQVLRLVANCLSEAVKGQDTAARFGGEEFTVILPRTPLSSARQLAEQIRVKVESKQLVKKSTGDILGAITISIGVAQYQPNENAVDLVRRADACLYAAKHAGRNRIASEPDDAGRKAKTTEAA